MYFILKLSLRQDANNVLSCLVSYLLIKLSIAPILCATDNCDEFNKLTNFQLNHSDLDLIELWSEVEEGGGFDEMMRMAQLSKVNIIKFNPR